MADGNGNNGLPPDLLKVYGSLNAEQKRTYNEFPTQATKNLFLRGIIQERNKSEIGSEITAFILYVLTTFAIAFLNGVIFTSVTATNNFVIILHVIYFITRVVILGVMFERNGMIYYLNKWVQFFVILPTILGVSLAVSLGIRTLAPIVSIVFINVGIEGSRIIIRCVKY